MTWKLATFNVNGIRARLATVVEWISVHQPDVLCCQEIKCQEKDFPARPFEEAGYHVSLRGQKSFNGVALITRNPPEALVREFSDGQPDDEARFIAARIDGVWVVNTYVPQGRDPDNPAFQSKLQFFRRLNHWFEKQWMSSIPNVWKAVSASIPWSVRRFPRCVHGASPTATGDIIPRRGSSPFGIIGFPRALRETSDGAWITSSPPVHLPKCAWTVRWTVSCGVARTRAITRLCGPISTLTSYVPSNEVKLQWVYSMSLSSSEASISIRLC